jgi:hypothetical protein
MTNTQDPRLRRALPGGWLAFGAGVGLIGAVFAWLLAQIASPTSGSNGASSIAYGQGVLLDSALVVSAILVTWGAADVPRLGVRTAAWGGAIALTTGLVAAAVSSAEGLNLASGGAAGPTYLLPLPFHLIAWGALVLVLSVLAERTSRRLGLWPTHSAP